MTTNRPLRVFLCHSSNDKPVVRELYLQLRAEAWLQPWLDEEELYPGQDWNLEIEKAVEAADVILVCLSKGSTTKEGYVQREIRIALEYADYKPEGTLYVIPVRLEECEPPRSLRTWQHADYFEGQRERAFQRLLVSLKKRADGLALTLEETAIEEKKPVSVSSNKIDLSNGMELLRVPAGKFLMGSTDDNKRAYDNEKPRHRVDIPYDYFAARFPVTNELYQAYVRAKGIKHLVSDWESKRDHPVVNVSWQDVVAYCQWLTESLKHDLPSGLVLRLPTEAEWEKAAGWKSSPSGKSKSKAEALEYPWGASFDKNKCNTYEAGKGTTTPVGLYSPQGDSPYGCADMSGNVREWTHSLLKSYPYQFDDGREDEARSGKRVLRGGSFRNYEGRVRCSFRTAVHIDDRDDNTGFRLVASCILP